MRGGNPEALTSQVIHQIYNARAKGLVWSKIARDISQPKQRLAHWRSDGRRRLDDLDDRQLGLVGLDAKIVVNTPEYLDIKDLRPPITRTILLYTVAQWADAEYETFLLNKVEDIGKGTIRGDTKALLRLLSIRFPRHRERPHIQQDEIDKQQSTITKRLEKEVALLEARIAKLTEPPGERDALSELNEVLARAHAKSPYNPDNLSNGPSPLALVPNPFTDQD